MRYAAAAFTSIRRPAFAGLLLALSVCAPTVLRAQNRVLIVSVADVTSGKPLEGAQVRLPETGRESRTDWIGEVKFSNVSAGSHLVTVRVLGYAPGEIKVLVAGDSTGAVFMLEPTATMTDTVRVVAESKKVPPHLVEFDAHKTLGIARILPESVLAKTAPDKLALTIVTRFSRLKISSFNGHDVLKGADAACNVRLFLDGLPMTDDIFLTLDPKALAGVEFYPMISAPAQYRRTDKCATEGVVLLFWSK